VPASGYVLGGSIDAATARALLIRLPPARVKPVALLYLFHSKLSRCSPGAGWNGYACPTDAGQNDTVQYTASPKSRFQGQS
jgi:hypothetical protein